MPNHVVYSFRWRFGCGAPSSGTFSGAHTRRNTAMNVYRSPRMLMIATSAQSTRSLSP